MNSEDFSPWEWQPLESICERVSVGHVGETTSAFTTEPGVPLIRSQNVRPGRVDLSDIKYITPEFDAKSKKSQLLDGDLLVVRVGQNRGDCAVLPSGLGRVNCANIVFARPLPAYSDFLGVYFNTARGREQLLALSSGSAQLVLNTKAVAKTLVPVPPPAEAAAIGAFGRQLGDRTTLLRETNATLEAIAQALFKSWFVDFDPVRAKQRGLAPAGMDEATAALFPDCLETSDCGAVPSGWKPASVYEMATYINGAAYKAFDPNGERLGRPIIKIAELKSGVTTQTAFSAVDMPAKYLIATGDILFSWSGNPDTSIDTFVWSHEPAWLNQHIFRVLPHSAADRAFVLQLLRHLRPVFAELARNKQTTGLGHVTVADLKRLRLAKPSADVIAAFDDCATPIQSRMFANQQLVQTLTTLRDTLLPRLISGQLHLPAAEALAT